MQFQKWRARQADGKAQNAISRKIGPIRREMPAFFQMKPTVIADQFHIIELRSGGFIYLFCLFDLILIQVILVIPFYMAAIR